MEGAVGGRKRGTIVDHEENGGYKRIKENGTERTRVALMSGTCQSVKHHMMMISFVFEEWQTQLYNIQRQ